MPVPDTLSAELREDANRVALGRIQWKSTAFLECNAADELDRLARRLAVVEGERDRLFKLLPAF